MPRIAIIGAGSVEFTRNVVADLCSFEELHGSVTIALHDIDEERLTYAHRAYYLFVGCKDGTIRSIQFNKK